MKPNKQNETLTPESAYYSLSGPKDQQEADLNAIVSDLKNYPGEWGLDASEESALMEEARRYLAELRD